MWLVYGTGCWNDDPYFLGVFTTEQKAIEFRDAEDPNLKIEKLDVDPVSLPKYSLAIAYWKPGRYYGERYVEYRGNDNLESTWSENGAYHARALTQDKAKELLSKSIPPELQEEFKNYQS